MLADLVKYCAISALTGLQFEPEPNYPFIVTQVKHGVSFWQPDAAVAKMYGIVRSYGL